MFGDDQINGQNTNNVYKRVGDLTIASPSTSSIISDEYLLFIS
jgi:hypothetical protein